MAFSSRSARLAARSASRKGQGPGFDRVVRNLAAAALAEGQFSAQVVPSKKHRAVKYRCRGARIVHRSLGDI